jgi:metal-dependent amidase/aminoacylase/carboxypeptidase family protein
VRDQVIAAVERIVRAEAAASGAPAEPEISVPESFPAVVNDAAACAATQEFFDAGLGPGRVFDPGLVTGSEDVGILASAAGAPCVYWLLGGAGPAQFAAATGIEDIARIVRGLPSNHSPLFAPVIEPTLATGVAALVSAARGWLPAG